MNRLFLPPDAAGKIRNLTPDGFVVSLEPGDYTVRLAGLRDCRPVQLAPFATAVIDFKTPRDDAGASP
jgi:hypothetical protein